MRILLIGNAIKDAEIKEVEESGNHYADFTVAARNRTGRTAYYSVRCSGKLAGGKGIEAIKKGTHIFVDGEPDSTTYTNEGGTKRIPFKVVAKTYQILSDGRYTIDEDSLLPVKTGS